MSPVVLKLYAGQGTGRMDKYMTLKSINIHTFCMY